jgi:hypothetical protein
MILINGALHNQSEWLGDQLAHEEYSQLFVEHISVKKIARSLGYAALSTLNSVALYDAVSRSLSERDSANLVLVSNYPRHFSQIDDIYELALLDGRRMVGLIVPDNPKADAIRHILTDHPASLTVTDAEATLQRYQQSLDPIVLEFCYRKLPFQFIDMSKSEPETIRDGVDAIQYLLLADDNKKDERAP